MSYHQIHTAKKRAANNGFSEVFDVFDESQRPIGTADRDEVHTKGLRHQTFHCRIVSKDKAGKEYLMFQLRSDETVLFPHTLDISSAGHLESGESPLDGVREVKEELGVKVLADNLIPLGMHIEVRKSDTMINREFEYVYLLRDDTALEDYTVQPSEVIGLCQVELSDGIKLFSGQVDEIIGMSVEFDSYGKAKGSRQAHPLHILQFTRGQRNDYFIKVFLLAKRYFAGEKLLYI